MSKSVIVEARKELIRAGCTNATGNALRFMYANLLAFEQGLSITANSVAWPIPEVFDQVMGITDEEIRASYLRLRSRWKEE